MSTHERTLDVIKAFYDAAMDESLWPMALKDLTNVINGQAASFWVLYGSETPRLSTFICLNFDVESIKEYLQHTASIDPTVRYLVSHPQQHIVHDGLVISEREKDKHPYYAWHNQHIETRFRMVGQTRVAPKVQAGVALHRTRKAGRYEPRDIDRFAVLHAHLEKALAVSFRLSSLGAKEQVNTEWLDRNPAAVLFLSEQKHVVFSNRAAQKIQADGDGISLGPGGVTLTHQRSNQALQSLIGQVLSPIGADSSCGGAMRSPRPSGKRPYGINISPVSRQYSALSGFRPAICIVITDSEQTALLPHQQLSSAFGLTGAEAKLAALLAAGGDLRSAADKLSISYATARTRLAEIFQKTSTRRQAELVHLILTTFPSR